MRLFAVLLGLGLLLVAAPASAQTETPTPLPTETPTPTPTATPDLVVVALATEVALLRSDIYTATLQAPLYYEYSSFALSFSVLILGCLLAASIVSAVKGGGR